MTLRRQRLSQRRKAVGFTQESLAEYLGVERSTVVRWEAGDTEPLPSIRPKVAHALQVSVDQLAELLTGSGNAGTTPALSADNVVTVPVLLTEVPSETRPDRTEFEDLTHPQVAETIEALRQALRSTGVLPEDLGAMLLFGRPSQVPLGSAALSGHPADIAHPAGIDTVGADVRPDTRPRRFNRLAVMGVLLILAFAGGAASVPLISSYRGPISPAADGASATATPVAAIPAPDPGSSSRSEDSTKAVHTVPAAEPSKPADGPATMPAPHTIRSNKRITSWSKPPAAMMRPARPRIPAEVAAWSQTARLSASDRRMTRLRSEILTRRP